MFINFSIIGGPLSDDFAIIFRYFFGIVLFIDLCIDFVDFQGPQMDPWDNILRQGASKKHWALPTGPPDLATRARHGAENGLNTILIHFGAICLSIWVEVVERRRRKRQNDTTLQ